MAGIGDALSTYFEGLSNVQTQHENYVWCDKKPFVSTLSGRAVAKECFDTLMAAGIQAKLACERHILVPALENIIESNILMSGLGFENVGCSVAHAIGNAITVLPEGFHDLQIEPSEGNLHLIARESLEAVSWQACSRTYGEEDIVQIMRMADALGCSYLSKK